MTIPTPIPDSPPSAPPIVRTSPPPVSGVRAWLRNRPLGVKLRASLLLVLLVAFAVVLRLTQTAYNSLSLQNLQRSQSSQAVNVARNIQQVLLTHVADASSITQQAVNTQALSDYLDSLNPNNQAGVQTPAMQNALAANLTLQMTIRTNVRSVRFSLPDGRQAVNIVRDSATNMLMDAASSQLGNDANVSGFANLATLRHQPYYMAIEPPKTSTSSVPGMTYLVAVPFARSNRYEGAFLIEFDEPNVTGDFFGTPLSGVLYAVRDSANEEVIARTTPNYAYNGTFQTLSGDTGIVPFRAADRVAAINSPTGITLNTDTQITTHVLIPLTTVNGPAFWEVIVSQSPALITATPLSTLLPFLIVFLVLGVATLFIERVVTSPLRELAAATRRIRDGNFGTPVPQRGRDEIGQLGEALNTMSAQVSSLLTQMETRVIARTRDVEVLAEISRDVAASRDIDSALNSVIEQLRQQFNFYHVQVFLVDNAGEYAVLRSSTGEAGKTLLSYQHRLRIGSKSIVGQATSTGQATVTQDTDRGGIPYFPNPLLPETRSEMALPIRAGRSVLGALDVQSRAENDFSDDDLRIFQILADQLAITIQNARLIEANQYEAQRAQTLLNESTEGNWRTYLTENEPKALAYRYDMLNVRPLDPAEAAAIMLPTKTTRTAQLSTMKTPIAVRGTSVGDLSATGNEGESLTADDRRLIEAVAERVALAIDNVRLNQTSLIARGEVERLYEINRQLSSASGVQAIYRLLAEQIETEPLVERLNVLAADPVGTPAPQGFIYVLRWDRTRKATMTLDALPGNRIPLHDLAFLDVNRTGAPYEIDLNQSFNPLITRPVVAQQDIQSMVAVPIAIAGRWFGLIVIQSRQPKAFTARFLEFLTALSDQAAVALENRYLFEQAETGRATLQSVLEALPVGVLVIDVATRQVVLFNTRALNYLSQPTTLSQISLNDVREYIPAIDMALSNGTAMLLSFEPPASDNSERRFTLQSSMVRDERDKPLSLIVALNDITELRTAQAAVEQQLLTASELSEFEGMIAGQADLPALMNVVGVQLRRLQSVSILYFVWQTEEQGITDVYQWLPGGGKAQLVAIGADRQLPFPTQILTEHSTQNLYNVALSEPNMQVARLSSYPLRSRARIGGWLIIGSREINLSSENEGLFATVLDRLALLAEALRLQRQTEVALRETARLYVGSRAISGSQTSADTAITLREQLRSLNPDRVDVFLRESHTDAPARWVEHWVTDGKQALEETTTKLSIDDISAPAVIIIDMNQASRSERLRLSNVPGLAAYQAIVEQPIQVKAGIVGRLIVAFDVPRGFSPDDLRFIETLCEQAATVVDNAVLYQESQQSLEETSILYQAGSAIVNQAQESKILPEIADYSFPSQITRAMLFRFMGEVDHAAKGTLIITSDWSRDAIDDNLSGRSFGPDEASLYNLLNTPDLYYIEDVENAGGLDEETRQLCLSLNLASLIIIPLAVTGRAIGALLVASDAHYEFTDREMRIYSSLAAQAAVALDNRSLLRQTQARARQIQTTLDVGRATTSILNLNELLQQTVYLIKDSFSYDHVQIFLTSSDGKEARLQASTGEPGRQLLAAKHTLTVGSSSVIGRVTASGQLYNVQDTQDPNSTHKPNPYLPQTRSELALPLIARGKVIGALDVQSNIARAFAPDDEQVLSTLSDQIAVAISNATLFGQNEQRLSEQRFLFNATRAAMTAETEVAFSRVTRQILDNTPSDLVVLFIAESSDPRWRLTYAAREGMRYVLPSGMLADFGLLGDLARTRLPIVRMDNGAGKLFSADDVPDVRALALLPLNAGDELFGALAVCSAQVDVYTPELVQLLQTLVSSLAAIVQNTRLLNELQEANVQLQKVDLIKSQFLANMSHELRTPLNSIIGFSRVILKGLDGPLNETQTQDLTTVFESGKHLLNLVNAILDQAKIEAGKMEVQQVAFDVTTSIKTAMSTVIGLVKDKPIRLHQELQADLPEVYGDETRLTQILLNMLSNAAKFTQQGSITLSAFTIVENEQQLVQISVADTGIGIPPESLDRVFAAFEQVDNSVTRGAEGTGLGMPIARALIEMMGGRIWVESTIGAGSTFSIVLPTQASEQILDENEPVVETAGPDAISPELADQVEQALSDAKNPDFEHRIIIALDDEPGMFNLFRRYLTKSGYEVIGTTKPDELVELVMTYQARAVLLDINMPNHNGWDILQMLKSRPETFDYPVIMCSIEDDKLRGHRLGASGYLVKPFLEEELYDVLKRIELERHWPLVLIIDDQPESLRLMRDTLQLPDLNIRILEATNGDQGLAMIGSQHPAIVILDVRMPDPDGFAVIEALRADPATADLTVLLVTAAELNEAERTRLHNERVEYKGQLTGDDLVRYVRERLAQG